MTSQNNKKQNISLIIGLAIPVAMILFIGIAINGPRWFNSVEPPKYNFLYVTGEQGPYVVYTVEKGRLVVTENKPESAPETIQYPVHFFVHDVVHNTNREIQIEDALSLRLDGSVRSPDGFTINTGRSRGWFIFGFGGYNGEQYLVKDSFSEKLDLESDTGDNYYYWNFRFLGWVIDGG